MTGSVRDVVRPVNMQGVPLRRRVTGSAVPAAAAFWLLLAGFAPAVQAQAEPPPPADTATIFTLQTENDLVGRTDRNYTAGLRLGITLPTGDMPDFVSRAGRSSMGDGIQRLSLDLSQTIFTPKDTAARKPNPRDRPYAAVLTGQFNLVHDTDGARTLIGLGLGVLGPAAEGESLQNGFHDLIHDAPAKGWRYQIANMPVVQIVGLKVWRIPVIEQGVLQMDVLPSLAAAAGTWRNYAQAGFQVRVGQGLDTDFGSSRISPGLTGADAYTPTRTAPWYFFVGADGQAIARDATLDGNPWRSGPHVGHRSLVGELEAGLAIMYDGWRFSYTHVVQTPEYAGQRGSIFQFGSFTIAARF
jgi:hypothetical protein